MKVIEKGFFREKSGKLGKFRVIYEVPCGVKRTDLLHRLLLFFELRSSVRTMKQTLPPFKLEFLSNIASPKRRMPSAIRARTGSCYMKPQFGHFQLIGNGWPCHQTFRD